MPVPPGETLDALIRLLAGQPESSPADAIVRVRLPRIALSAVVGAGLAASGAALQGLFRNAMADPYLLGISAGGALGATLAIALGLGITTLGLAPVPLFRVSGRLAAAWAVYALGEPAAACIQKHSSLAGVALSALLSAAISFLIALSAREEVVSAVHFWTLGGFYRADWSRVWIALPYALLGMALAWLYSRDLNALLLGEECALNLGVDVERRNELCSSARPSRAPPPSPYRGIIGFVGLIAPHIVRLIQGPDHRALIPASALTGALFLVICDTLARTLFAPTEMPIGVLTAFTGVPFFLSLLRRSRRVSRHA